MQQIKFVSRRLRGHTRRREVAQIGANLRAPPPSPFPRAASDSDSRFIIEAVA